MHDELGLAETFQAQAVSSRKIRSGHYESWVHGRDYLSASLAFERTVFIGCLPGFYFDFLANDMEV